MSQDQLNFVLEVIQDYNKKWTDLENTNLSNDSNNGSPTATDSAVTVADSVNVTDSWIPMDLQNSGNNQGMHSCCRQIHGEGVWERNNLSSKLVTIGRILSHTRGN